MRPLRTKGLFLSFLPQPQLSEVSPPSNPTLDLQATRSPAAVPLLPADFHLTRPTSSVGTNSSQNRIQPADEGRRRCLTKTGLGPSFSRRSHRLSGRTAHLDARHALSSPRSHARDRRRPFTGWHSMGPTQKSQVPGSRQGFVADLQGEDMCGPEKSQSSATGTLPGLG